ncbi:MAG: transglycosylase domain-containing protein, partial [Clostridia bacterium]|nr:transglycosylase domain-containing protein [Clostridia bacterium]
KEGASTISQQYIKNKYLTNDKTIERKIKEIYLTNKLENSNSKDEIIEAYLNTIYFGNGAYGIGNASKYYFNKDTINLTIAESAILAGIIKSPAHYSPINNIENCLNRRNIVLKEMKDDNIISYEEYNQAINEPITLNLEYSLNNPLDYYTEFVIDEACKILNITKNELINQNYTIKTYKDTKYQDILNNNMENYKSIDINTYGNTSDKLAIIQNSTGDILAVSGYSKYDLINLNRQPGSTIKPILVYAPALEEGKIHLCSQILDEKTTFDNYSPKNVSDKYYGYVSINDAVAKSLNIPAIKIMSMLGIEKCKNYAKLSGIKFNENDIGYSIALGGFNEGITLNSLLNSYSPFINEGKYSNYGYIKEIIDASNNVVYQRKYDNTKVYNSDTTYLVNTMLQHSVKTGTSKRLSDLCYEVAGKTGTVASSNNTDNQDVYSIGYTSELLVGIWFGNYTMDEKYNLSPDNNGGTYATSFICDVFNDIYSSHTPPPFNKANNVEKLYIDKISLNEDHIIELAPDNYPDIYKKEELFSSRYKPSNYSMRFNRVEIPKITTNFNKNSLNIKFEAKDYYHYKIIEKYNNKSKVIKEISNTNDFIDFEIKLKKNNTEYRYYLEITSSINNETKIVEITKIYNQLYYDDFKTVIDKEHKYSNWFFR